MADDHTAKVLVVDDETNVRDVIERSLRKVGYEQVAQAESVADARRQLTDQGPFALVILDIRMPGEPGMKLLEELGPLAPETVTIMATAIADIETAVKALRAGAYDYLIKPLIPDGVQIAVARALRRRRLEIGGVERRQLVEDLVRTRTETLEATRSALLNALCQMAEFRDPETGEHLQRIPEYARTLAVDMAQNSPYADVITDDFIAKLVESSPLHDIGKVAISDNVLLKTGKLTAEEFELIKMHTVLGRDVCVAVKNRLPGDQSDFIDMAIAVAYSHHERWDGRGYPEGLSGQEIPLSGRIVHLADFYDACRSPRVYRPEPIAREKVVPMIEVGRGTQFDPEVVDSFFRVRKRFVEIEEEYSS